MLLLLLLLLGVAFTCARDADREAHVVLGAEAAGGVAHAVACATRRGDEVVLAALLELERVRHRRVLDKVDGELEWTAAAGR